MGEYYIKVKGLEEFNDWIKIFNEYNYHWVSNTKFIPTRIQNGGECYLCIDNLYQITYCYVPDELDNGKPISKHKIFRMKKLERICK